MRRREALVFLAGAAVTWPFAARAHAQQPGKVYRIGVLSLHNAKQEAAANIGATAFHQRMRALGYIDGQSVLINVRHADGSRARLQSFAAEFAAASVDVIVAFGTDATRAARETTSTIPIVMAAVGDPIGSGFVASLARPGRNITGVALLIPEVVEKQLEMLKEAAPRIQKVACLRLRVPQHDRLFADLEGKARAMGLVAVPTIVATAEDLPRHFADMSAAGVDAFLVFLNPTLDDLREQIGDLGLLHRLPGVGHQPFYVQAGVLLSYGASLSDLHARSAIYVDKILKGANPAELPVEQAERLKLAVNLKTAKALGIEIPPSVLARADEVIE